jgi:1-acyl-sn-glycerol-3-phosphate acyltransferase
VIRTLVMVLFWAIAMPMAAVIGFPWTLLTGNIRLLYWLGTRAAWAGVRLGGVRVVVIGREQLQAEKTYVFLSNHASNLDPPILIPLIPRRTSVLVKKELFRIPILGRAMRMASLVPVDRSNRDAAVASLRRAAQVLRQGISMTIFVEGTRSADGRLLPFKKGPFYLAMDAAVEVVPVTIAGTHELMPKTRMSIRPGTVTVTFHPAVDPRRFDGRESLMEAVRTQIASALPEELRS